MFRAGESGGEGEGTREAILLVLITAFLTSCGGGPPAEPRDGPKEDEMAINLTSTAFDEGDAIASRYTCDGPGISPPLSWDAVPDGTRSLALIADDPDAPGDTFVHWVVYDLPPDTRQLPEGVPNRRRLSSGAEQGVNGAGGLGYAGPCPPSGTHRYYFKIYALDAKPGLGAGATAERLSDALEGHVLAEGRLMGTYRKR